MMKLLSPFLIVVLFLKYGDLCMLKSPNWLLTNGTNSSFNRLHSSFNPNVTRSFSIDYESDTFLKDSAPFQFISATFNLYNVPHELWKDRLNKFWAVGLNTIQIHVLWDQHEPYPDVYDFEDEKNISRLLSLAQEFGFNVILRTGGLSDNVGLPWWLSDSDFKVNKTKEWFNVLLPRIAPFLYKNGGPIIAVQLEIDYDAYFTCDFNNTSLFKSIFKKNLGDDVIYFAKVESAFKGKSNSSDPMCNQTKDVYPVSGGTVREALQYQRSYSSHGPLVNSEFKIGLSDSWSRPHFKYDIIRIVEQFVETQGMRANINFEGFYGGTNFGTRSNAQKTTSNDQDGAISESGDITHKYLVIRAAISRFFEIPEVPTPSNPLKKALGKVDMKYFVPLVDVILGTSSKCVKSDALPTFESLGQRYGIILYTTDLSQYDLSNTSISISGIKGRAYVQIGHKSFGTVVGREKKNISVEIPKGKDQSQVLYIVVENLDDHGLFNQTNLTAIRSDIKSDPSVSINGEALKNWNSCITDNFIPNFRKKLSDQKSVDLVSKYAISDNLLSQKNLSLIDFSIPGVYIGEFNGSDVDYDTFLRMDNFERGFALIQSNESVINLGQYWPHVGPQVTLYTPSVFLTKSSKNHVILFELEKSIGCQSYLTCNVEFIDHPIIDSI